MVKPPIRKLSSTRADLNGAVHTVRQEMMGVVAFIAIIWSVFLLDLVTPIERFGLVPRTLSGLPGIVMMTFLHANWPHLLSNTVPLFVLLTLLAGSRARSWSTIAAIIVIGGVLLWLFGRPARHIGASLLVFGLISYLLASGLLFERRPVPVAIALIVGFLYGIPMFTGIVPRIWTADSVSWDGHLCGVIAGFSVAYVLARSQTGSRREAVT
jgi:membrane associated rhomboid family serine protease